MYQYSSVILTLFVEKTWQVL